MKALLRKDFYVLKKQLGFFAVAIVAFYILPNVGSNVVATLYAVMLPTSAFTYDDHSRWGELAAMMPYSTWDIVLSRYVLGWLSVLTFTAIGACGQLALYRVLGETFRGREIFVLVCIALCLMALSLPVYFRYDVEKSRFVRLLMVMLICGTIGGVMALMGADTEESLVRAPLWVYPLIAVACNAASVFVAMAAYRVRRRKE